MTPSPKMLFLERGVVRVHYTIVWPEGVRRHKTSKMTKHTPQEVGNIYLTTLTFNYLKRIIIIYLYFRIQFSITFHNS